MHGHTHPYPPSFHPSSLNTPSQTNKQNSAYPKQGLIGVQTVAKFRSPDAPSLPVRIYLVNIRCVLRRMCVCVFVGEGGCGEAVGRILFSICKPVVVRTHARTPHPPPPYSLTPPLSCTYILTQAGAGGHGRAADPKLAPVSAGAGGRRRNSSIQRAPGPISLQQGD